MALACGVDGVARTDDVSRMSTASSKVPDYGAATVEEKLALIDELWESVRRAGEISPRADHLEELQRRVEAVAADPSLALSPKQARALLRE